MVSGKGDFVSVKREGGGREHVQKRLLLLPYREAYAEFKAENRGVQLGLSMFYKLKPRHIICPGQSNTHNVCVCVYHQNVKLKILTTSLNDAEEIKHLIDYKEEMTDHKEEVTEYKATALEVRRII